MISLEKWWILTPIQKLPKNEGDLGKLIVTKGIKKVPKVQKIAKSGHTATTSHRRILFKLQRAAQHFQVKVWFQNRRMKHKRQHTNGIVSKEERTIRIRQLLGSPTTPIRIPKQPDDDLPTSSDVIKTSDEDMMVNDEEGRRRAPKFAKAKKKFAKSGSGSDLVEVFQNQQDADIFPAVDTRDQCCKTFLP